MRVSVIESPTRSPEIIHKDRWLPNDLRQCIAAYNPRSELGQIVRACFGYLPTWAAAEVLDRISRILVIESSLSVMVYRACDACGKPHVGHAAAPVLPWCSVKVEDYGVTSRKVITTVGVGFLVDAWQNIVELEIMKYHGLGTGSTAEAVGDTALVTELVAQYNPDSTRATGSTTEGASGNIFRSVGTNTLDVGATIAEHGLFSVATAATGVLWDRSLTGTQTLSAADSLQTTYDMTATAGG